jgi:hypothetical protein
MALYAPGSGFFPGTPAGRIVSVKGEIPKKIRKKEKYQIETKENRRKHKQHGYDFAKRKILCWNVLIWQEIEIVPITGK